MKPSKYDRPEKREAIAEPAPAKKGLPAKKPAPEAKKPVAKREEEKIEEMPVGKSK